MSLSLSRLRATPFGTAWSAAIPDRARPEAVLAAGGLRGQPAGAGLVGQSRDDMR